MQAFKDNILPFITIAFSIASIVISLINNARTDAFKETQRYFEPLSGILQTDPDHKMNVYLQDGEGPSRTIQVDRLVFHSYQGGIQDCSVVGMSDSGATLVSSPVIREDPNKIDDTVDEYDLSLANLTFSLFASAEMFRYYDTFLLITDYTGKRHLYLITLMTSDNDNHVEYYEIYDERVLLEADSTMVIVDGMSTEVKDIEAAQNGEVTATKRETYAMLFSDSLKRYKTLLDNPIFDE